jgi:tRNA 2-thiouridine synthesizing protein A
MTDLDPRHPKAPPLRELDTTGLRCPEPVLRLHAEVRQAGPLVRIRVIATDPSTQRDIPRFCQFLGHTLVQQVAHDGRFEFIIETKPAAGAS